MILGFNYSNFCQRYFCSFFCFLAFMQYKVCSLFVLTNKES